MPSVYDFRHIELDKVGRGKKRISLESSDGGFRGTLVTPSPIGLGKSFTDGRGSSNGSSPNGSRPNSRRGSRGENTQTRLFGPVEVDSPRRVKDLFVSSVFAVDSPPATPKKMSSPAKGTYTPPRRNPITGDILSEALKNQNGGPKMVAIRVAVPSPVVVVPQEKNICNNNNNGSNGNSNGSIASSSLSLDSSSISSK